MRTDRAVSDRVANKEHVGARHVDRVSIRPIVDRILDTRLWKYYLGPTSLRPVIKGKKQWIWLNEWQPAIRRDSMKATWNSILERLDDKPEEAALKLEKIMLLLLTGFLLYCTHYTHDAVNGIACFKWMTYIDNQHNIRIWNAFRGGAR